MKRRPTILILVAGLAALVAMSSIAGAAALAWLIGVRSDSAGFLNSSSFRMSTPGYAITAPMELTAIRGIETGSLGTLRITVASNQGVPVFLGIAPRQQADAYLAGVASERVSGLVISPWKVVTQTTAGTRAPESPELQGFWSSWVSGPGARTLSWPIRSGDWELVVMNANAQAGLSLDTRVAVKSGLLPLAAGGAGVFGLLLLVVAGILLYAALRSPREAAEPVVPSTAAGTYPLRLRGSLLNPPGRALWIIKWVLIIPHLLALCLLWAASALATIAAGLAILFTGRYPRAIFDFNVGLLRWQWRVAFYSVGAFATDQYPPFSLEPDPSYPAELEVEYPEHLSRGLVLVKSWLLAIPHYLVIGILSGGWILGWDGWRTLVSGGLIGVLALVAVVVFAVKGSYPTNLFDLLMGLNRWVFRVFAYALLMTDRYPPFRLDMGGDEPPASPSAAPEPAAPSAGEPL
ncbi:MAG: DUF4389 domain-containing protein [Actinomycetota bacterium]|nr:DUF4389 domain-containing protein [Actinomycetota bacterium]